nr:hypothetical protein [Acetobacter syzygii]
MQQLTMGFYPGKFPFVLCDPTFTPNIMGKANAGSGQGRYEEIFL